ncbi:hypothetical protein [Paenibacillus sp. SN-8-1]|uniref:hypothetical protein n=1 Tax=Paenibacillus sp. SN-8-1 TaxID=3435409 RepID=UPI003D9A3ED5
MEGKLGTVGAKRSPTSFLKESYIGSISFVSRFHLCCSLFKKSGENSDRKSKHSP